MTSMTFSGSGSSSGSATADQPSAKGKHPKRLAGEGSGTFKRTYVFDIEDEYGKRQDTTIYIYIYIIL